MSKIVNGTVQTIARGTGITFTGTIISLGLAFITTIILVRYISQSEYGIYSLAITVLDITVVLALLGLTGGVARYIGYFKGKNDAEKISQVASSSIKFVLLAAIPLGLLLYLTSDLISTNIFHSSELSLPLRILAIGLPFVALRRVLVSIFRGLFRVEVAVYFESILYYVLLLLFVLLIVFLRLDFIIVFYAYLASCLLTFGALLFYTLKKFPVPIRIKGSNPMGKELLFFSLPLLAAGMVNIIFNYTDILVLGNLMKLSDVGVYNAAVPLAPLVGMPITATLMIYMPVISSLYSRNLMDEMRRTYIVLAKWISFITVPLFLVIVLYPETMLSLVFGSRYALAGTALIILSLGQLIYSVIGPNGATLTALGKTKFVMWSYIFGAGLNIPLNFLLIPRLGIVGAAIATVISMTLMLLMRGIRIYFPYKIQPISKNLLKPMIASTILIVAIHFIASNFLQVTLWMLPIILVLFYVLYGLAVLLTRSLDHEDIELLLEIEKRTGINLSRIKKVLARFL